MPNKYRGLRQWMLLAAGVFLAAASFPLFFIPNDIAPGGVSGLSMIVHALTGFPVGTLAAVINIPLFVVSWKRMGQAFSLRSLICMLGVSILIDLLPVGPATADPILACVFGGVILGTGLGLVIRGGATTGGTDMAAAIIHERLPVITVGGFLLALDFGVILLSSLAFDMQSAMYATISIFLSTQVMDRVIEGFERAKAFFVFSRKSKEIADVVLKDLARGATLLHARGAYSGQEREVLLCVMTRLQIPRFKAMVRDVDPDAFLIVTDVREALGEGFTRPPA
ncbi:MAG: YitT family protein [Firmicutes bacterium]|nr:YitT family protein [Bacillota bacterium]